MVTLLASVHPWFRRSLRIILRIIWYLILLIPSFGLVIYLPVHSDLDKNSDRADTTSDSGAFNGRAGRIRSRHGLQGYEMVMSRQADLECSGRSDMKMILSSSIPGEISHLRSMLESAGIDCFVRNEISAGLSPEIPISESTPELWIQDDQRLAEALEIKQAWKTSAPTGGSAWVCKVCGETSEPQFTSCWKCGASKS